MCILQCFNYYMYLTFTNHISHCKRTTYVHKYCVILYLIYDIQTWVQFQLIVILKLEQYIFIYMLDIVRLKSPEIMAWEGDTYPTSRLRHYTLNPFRWSLWNLHEELIWHERVVKIHIFKIFASFNCNWRNSTLTLCEDINHKKFWTFCTKETIVQDIHLSFIYLYLGTFVVYWTLVRFHKNNCLISA
jgi:hypothetical protein